MGRIYSQAANVVIWLGLSDASSRMALDFLRLRADHGDEAITSIFKANWDENTDKRIDLALRRTLNGRRYWYRLWIIQEILLGTRDIILCFGHDQISWEVLGQALERLRRYLAALPPEPKHKGYLFVYDLRVAVESGNLASLHLIRSIYRSSDSSHNVLRRWLGMSQSAECEKLHNKIYGLLGIVDSDIPVDYEKSIFEFYADTIHYFKHAFWKVQMINSKTIRYAALRPGGNFSERKN